MAACCLLRSDTPDARFAAELRTAPKLESCGLTLRSFCVLKRARGDFDVNREKGSRLK
jgi:hypothetical protein